MIANLTIGAITDLLQSDPAQAATVWSALDTVRNGLGGGNEVVGGLWTLLVSYAAWATGVFSRVLAGLGIVVGVAGIVTVVPALEDVGAIFGVGLIVWFAWLGIAMLSGRSSASPAGAPGRTEVGVAGSRPRT